MGSTIGRVVGACLRRDCNAIKVRLTQSDCGHVSVGQTWSDLGRRLFEFLALEKFLVDVDIDKSAHEAFKKAESTGTGVIVATSHLGHWELMAAALSSKGYSVHSIAGQPSPGPVNRALEDIRENLGVKTLHRGRGARRAIQILNRGETVAVFCDQNTDERSRDILFFGRVAPTPLTYERLQKVTQSRPLFVWNLYNGAGRYTVYAENIPTESDITGWIQNRLEQIIKEHPTQWVWLHDRWHRKSGQLR